MAVGALEGAALPDDICNRRLTVPADDAALLKVILFSTAADVKAEFMLATAVALFIVRLVV